MRAVPSGRALAGREDEEGWLRYVALAILAGLVLVAGSALGWWGHQGSAGDPAARATGAGAPEGGQAIDPSRFARGSCERFAPTAGDRHLTVFLDAGHGGIDPGAVGRTESGTTIEEASLTLPVELDATALLRAAGFTVVDSRTRDSTVLRLGPGDVSQGVLSLVGAHDEVAARDLCANEAHADLLVGIYFDASTSPEAAGCLTTYDAARPFAAENLRFADLLQSSVVAAMDAKGWRIPSDGVLDDVGMGSNNGDPATSRLAALAQQYDHVMLLGPAMRGYFSDPSRMPGALIEPLYITDPFEGTIAASAEGQQVMAEGIARAVERYFETKGPERR
jgi:N-acetylmuramoyl-L-alanine amidase